MYITYVTCVTYVTYGYVHMLQLIIIKTVGFIFSHLLAVKIFCLQPTLKNPHFHEMHQRVFCLQMFCFVCGIIAHKLSQSDFDRPFSQDQLKTYREWMPLSSRLSKMYFSLLFVSKLFWLDFLQLLVTVYSNSSIPYWNSITVHSVKVVKTINIQIFEKEKLSVF